MTVQSDNRISSSEIKTYFEHIVNLLHLRYRPAPLLFYKPIPSDPDKGTAMKVEYRLFPTFSDKGFLIAKPDDDEGGMFIDIAAFVGMSSSGFPQFHWNREEPEDKRKALVTTKLGIADLQQMLLAYQTCRVQKDVLPESMRTARKQGDKWVRDTEGKTLGLTHKFKGAVTIIEWQFRDKGSLLTVSRSKDSRRTTSLTLPEEISFVAYVQQALAVFLEVGKR